MGFMQINGINFDIPQELDLAGSLDERSGTYRISLGIVDPTIEQQAQYNPLFEMINSQISGLFLKTAVTFGEGAQRLKMLLATADIYNKSFGTFYDIESSILDTELTTVKEKVNDSDRNTGIIESKATKKNRKVTNSRKRASSRA